VTINQFYKDKVEFIGIDGNKMIFWCIASVVARHADGRPKLVAEIRRDITERE
jgi:PAS domain-containing protein